MSIYQDVDYALLNIDDYVKYRSSSSFNKVDSASQVTDDTFYFDTAIRLLTAQSSNAKSGGFNFYFENTYIGDIIEIECEIRSVTGEYPRIYFNGISFPGPSGIEADSTYMAPSQQGQWEFMKREFIVRNTQYNNYKFFIGLITNSAGKYQLRNLKVRLKRTVFNKKNEISKTYTINKYNGSWVFDEYSDSDKGNLSYEGNSLKVAFDLPFNKKPIPLVTLGNSLAVKYKIIANAKVDNVLITFYDENNVAVSAEAVVSNNTLFHLAVFGKN
ncbi:hypothetical protein DN392_06345 [Bacillus sp. BB51/4]|uniref:hypothetical protein n=1 Tax=Bacillus sp. BB51/4 TaxID=2217819 RepID=UPI0011EEB419|nr:hypothetical protein [Bacillus sp. BB51/4]KAA0777616.1 hypothetical protein DN392_06345 [Bacillus sp. BB51/4]